MNKKYLLADQTIDNQDIEDLIRWLQTNPWLTQGQLVKEFQKRWADWLGTEYAVYVNSGSSANLLMYYALLISGKLKNNKIIVPAISWSTTVAPAIQLGFTPIMCEAELDTFGLDPAHLEELLKAHDAGAVITVPVLGVPNKVDQILELKRQFQFVLMEDACAATGSTYDDQRIGTFGDISSFSFYFGHHLSTIEGGMICTNDGELNDILLQIRSHGWAKDLDAEKEASRARDNEIINFNRPFTFYHPGFNVRSTDLNARIGLSQMNKIDHVLSRRIENHRTYQSRFLNAPDFHCQNNLRADICSISFAALADSEHHRDRVADALQIAGVETRPLGGGNMSRQPYWSERYSAKDFSVADKIHTTGFQLPNHPMLDIDDVNFICDTVLSIHPQD